MSDQNETIDNLDALKEAIGNAVRQYQDRYSSRAQSPYRLANIQHIDTICAEENNVEFLLARLEDYFSSPLFYTGPRDNSVLEELIAGAVCQVNRQMGIGLETFGYRQSSYPAMNEVPHGAEDTHMNLSYVLNDFVSYAVDKYVQEKEGRIEKHRSENLRYIRHILATNDSDEQKKNQVREYIQSPDFSRAFNSRLKALVLTALDTTQAPRAVATRIWQSEETAAPQKILIYLHGWHDSVNSGDQLAREAVKQGYTVFAYDHRGHGKDSERQNRGISTDLLRLDFRQFLQHIQQRYPEADIALAGHSMGGALLTVENRFINRIPSVKSVSLIAPAVMSGLDKLISPAKIFYRNMQREVQIAQTASDRFGGKGPWLFGLLNLMRKASRALNTLLFRHDLHANWQVYAGERDISVNCSEFKALTHSNIQFFPRGDHALHFGRYAATANRKIVEDVERALDSPVTATLPLGSRRTAHKAVRR